MSAADFALFNHGDFAACSPAVFILDAAAFSNGIVKNTNQFSGSFAPMVISLDNLDL